MFDRESFALLLQHVNSTFYASIPTQHMLEHYGITTSTLQACVIGVCFTLVLLYAGSKIAPKPKAVTREKRARNCLEDSLRKRAGHLPPVEPISPLANATRAVNRRLSPRIMTNNTIIATELNRLSRFVIRNIQYSDRAIDCLDIISRWTHTRGLWLEWDAQLWSFTLLFRYHVQPLCLPDVADRLIRQYITLSAALSQVQIQRHFPPFQDRTDLEYVEGCTAFLYLSEKYHWPFDWDQLKHWFLDVVLKRRIKGDVRSLKHLNSSKAPKYLLTDLRMGEEHIEEGICRVKDLKTLLGVPVLAVKGIPDYKVFAYYCNSAKTFITIGDALEQKRALSLEEKATLLQDIFIY